MPKPLEQKQHEAMIRELRGNYVDAFRARKRFKNDCRSGDVFFDKENLRWYHVKFTQASRLFEHMVPNENDRKKLLDGWVL